MFRLTDRVALVTGAARGLGKAIAAGLAEQGALVAVVDRDLSAAEEAADAIRDAGGTASAFSCDIANEAEIKRTVATVEAVVGSIDILVNNAGITKRIPLADWTEADWTEVIRINQVGTFLMGREVGLRMAGRGRGSIVNVAALGGGLVGLGRGNAIYCSTKGAVVALTREFAAEWARRGVRVNCVAPGWFRTDMNTPLVNNPEFLSRILDRVPLARLGEPQDVVGPVVFLASDAAAMITGCVLPIDGGVSGVVSLSSEAVIK